MKKPVASKIVYWVSTSLLCLLYVFAAVMYLTQRPMVEAGFVYLGYPAYLVTLLIVAKIAAPLAILSRISVRLSDLAYAGVFFHLLITISAHLNAGDAGFVPAVVALVLVFISFFTQNAGRNVVSPNAPPLAASIPPRRPEGSRQSEMSARY